MTTKPEEIKLKINKEVTAPAEPLVVKVLKDHTIQLSIKEAEDFIDLQTFRGERPLNERHVQHLYDEWKKERFFWEHVILASALVKDDKKIYHVNGQHTCWMRIELPPSATCRVRKIDYEVPDQENLRRLYAVFDPAVAGRTSGHIVKALLAGLPEVEGVYDKYLKTIAAGVRMWRWEKPEERRRNGPNEIAAIITENSVLVQNVARMMQKNQKFWHMRKGPVVAAMLATYERATLKADDFWQSVCDGLKMEKDTDPRYKLRELLMGENRETRRRDVTDEELYRISIMAWNKWRDGEKVLGGLRSTDRRYKPKP